MIVGPLRDVVLHNKRVEREGIGELQSIDDACSRCPKLLTKPGTQPLDIRADLEDVYYLLEMEELDKTGGSRRDLSVWQWARLRGHERAEAVDRIKQRQADARAKWQDEETARLKARLGRS